MKNDVGVTVNFPGKIDDDTVQLLKGSGITYVRLVFSYPFGTDGVTPNPAYLMTKKTARRFYDAGIKVMAQSFWPGGRGYDDQTGTIKWFSNLPGFYNDFDDDYFYKTVKTATKFMAEDLKDICSTWLISNEIDINTYTGDMTFDQIIRYVKAATDGVRTGNPESSCGVNLLTEVWEAYSLKFVNALYGENPTLDWLGLDGYYGTLQQGGPDELRIVWSPDNDPGQSLDSGTLQRVEQYTLELDGTVQLDWTADEMERQVEVQYLLDEENEPEEDTAPSEEAEPEAAV